MDFQKFNISHHNQKNIRGPFPCRLNYFRQTSKNLQYFIKVIWKRDLIIRNVTLYFKIRREPIPFHFWFRAQSSHTTLIKLFVIELGFQTEKKQFLISIKLMKSNYWRYCKKRAAITHCWKLTRIVRQHKLNFVFAVRKCWYYLENPIKRSLYSKSLLMENRRNNTELYSECLESCKKFHYVTFVFFISHI